MHLTFILSILPIALAAPSTSLSTRTYGNMALESFSRTCNDYAKTCRYSFTVNEYNGEYSKPACAFTIAAAPGQANARLTDFSGVKCEGTNRFSTNGGWSADKSFIVVVPSE